MIPRGRRVREITAAELRQYLDLKPDGGCKLNRRIYTDPDIFELEMEAIWERSWVYLGHESQLRNKGDFLTTKIGRQPVVVSRDLKGRLAAFINVCTHRGATLCRLTSGNAKVWTCPYHGWTFGVDGDLLAAKDEKSGAYPPSFEKRSLGLTRVPHIESYRGLIFANLDPEAAPLRQQLGDVAVWIDLLLDQSPEGWEVLNGISTYVYHGNWKLQAENGVDGYHATTVHWNFNATLSNRQASNTAGEKIKAMKLVVDPAKRLEGGLYQLEHFPHDVDHRV
jgi:benzoate/toluate 1,2-dioxygenase subunit alpha